MKITFLGHAGLWIDTRFGSILCDPWFSPAFYGSWCPFPRNDHLDLDALTQPDFLYVSHGHRDHFDPAFLTRVSKDCRVLVPDFPLDDHERELRALGFTRLARLRSGVPYLFDGLTVQIDAASDEPTGDSALMVSDGDVSILNQNDSRPLNVESLTSFGRFDAHFVQFSGAMWFPAAYRLPQEELDGLARSTVKAQTDRALTYLRELGASNAFPCAGPACFLDPELWHLNDLEPDRPTIFQDQRSFAETAKRSGIDGTQVLLPGAIVDLRRGQPASIDLRQAESEAVTLLAACDADYPSRKEAYLRRYQQDWSLQLKRERQRWEPGADMDLCSELQAWLGPLVHSAGATASGIDAAILIRFGDEGVVLDFKERTVTADAGQYCRYRFFVPRSLLEVVTRDREVDWVNSLFLSCRFEAERDGPYNEWVYSFFKGLTPDRQRHLEHWYEEPPDPGETCELDGHIVQRRCPHFHADLARFGRVEGDVLTCTMHGWQFDLKSGRCLTAKDRRLAVYPQKEAS